LDQRLRAVRTMPEFWPISTLCLPTRIVIRSCLARDSPAGATRIRTFGPIRGGSDQRLPMRLLEAPFLPKGGSVEVLLSLACSGMGGSATVSPRRPRSQWVGST
jgi:hypothetical protein